MQRLVNELRISIDFFINFFCTADNLEQIKSKFGVEIRTQKKSLGVK